MGKVVNIIPTTGIGMKDYSSGIEFAVEPTIRSYQSVYSEWQTIAVAAGAIVIRNIAIPSAHVAIVYDFYATFPTFTLLKLTVQAVTGGLASNAIIESGYGSIQKHIAKGFPFFQTIRFILENLGSVDLDVNIGAVGISTDEEHYYMLPSAQVPVP